MGNQMALGKAAGRASPYQTASPYHFARPTFCIGGHFTEP
jgi:hypothetical protein